MRKPPDVGPILRAWRARLGLTQEALADALNVTFSTVSRWENGRFRPSSLAWKALERLAAERGAPDLLDDEPPELRMPDDVPPCVGARREDLQAVLPRVREHRLGEPRGDVTTAERRWGPGVLHIHDVPPPLVHDLGLEAVDAGREPSRRMLDMDVHRAHRDRRGGEVKPASPPRERARR